MHVIFNILDWRAWSPAQMDDQPDVSVIPPMLRRRLSPLARIAMSVIMPLADQYGAMPLVYVSRHGDLSRTLGLLEDVAKGEPLSPTAFSLSVHNATAGLFSIHQGLTKNVTAISCGMDDVVPALLESLGQCAADEPNVLCVFCDEPPPAIYSAQVSQPERPFAVALVISRENYVSENTNCASGENGHEGSRNQWKLETMADGQATTTHKPPQPLQLLALLKGDVKNQSFSSNGTNWQLSRCFQ